MDAALECYLRSIREIGEIVEATSPEIAASLRDSLDDLRSRVVADSGPAALERSADMLHEILRNFRAKVRLQNQTRARDLEQVELLASLDPLTAVANRRDLDRELAARIAAGKEFCVLLFDVNGFKTINDGYGHLCGDQVLKQVAARLASQVRVRDYVCRWGGDEFLAILACDLAIAASRSRQIAERLNGSYHIAAEGREIRVVVNVTVGCVQYRTGESAEELFRRADDAMYRQKHLTPRQSFPAG
jgi:diguanylate cyclase (GGDEF)-like protein